MGQMGRFPVELRSEIHQVNTPMQIFTADCGLFKQVQCTQQPTLVQSKDLNQVFVIAAKERRRRTPQLKDPTIPA